MKKKIFGFTVILIVLALLVGIAELNLQIKAYRKTLRNITGSDIFELAPFLQIRPKPNADPKIRINKDNFRGDELNRDPETYLIFTMGGSTTFQPNLPYSETYPAILEKKLRERYPNQKIQVQNAACDWYTTQHSLIRYLFKIRHYDPHLLIVMHAINDLCRSSVPEYYSRTGDHFRMNYSHYFGPLASVAKGNHIPFRHVLFWNAVQSKVLTWLPPDLRDYFPVSETDLDLPPVGVETEVKDFPSLRSFEANLRMFAKLAKDESRDIVFMTQPNIYRKNLPQDVKDSLYFGSAYMTVNGKYPNLDSMELGMRLFNDATLRVASQTETPVIDVERKVPKNRQYFDDDVHPTAATASIEAEMAFQKIVELGLLEKHLHQHSKSPKASDPEYAF